MSEVEDFDLLIVGASTRAAAFSALRAGLRPRCADLFADADLKARCPVERLSSGGYASLFADLASSLSNVPWMYTGGVENRRRLVERLAARRPLWGNNRDVLVRCRNPWFVASLLREAGLPHPAVRCVRDGPPSSGRWLVKPLRGAGGSGIAFAGENAPLRPSYLQEFIEGEPHAALFCVRDATVRLLGITRQMIGEPWLHARPFHYCGSWAGAEPTPTVLRGRLESLGTILTRGCGLRGLFGVDFILRDGVEPMLVEVNPRYTASVEVLEYQSGESAIAHHTAAFADLDGLRLSGRLRLSASSPEVAKPQAAIAKAVLFARKSFLFPAEGPWRTAVDALRPVGELPDFADVPDAGQPIEAGQPILTLFATALDPLTCLSRLRQSVDTLDPLLYER